MRGYTIKSSTIEKIKLISAIAIFGTIGIVRKNIIYSSSMVAMMRGVIGCLFLLLIHFCKREKFCVKAVKQNALLLCLSGALIGANWICLFEAYRYTTVSVATVCYYMAPVLVIAVSPIILRERLSKKRVFCILAAVVGVCFVSGIFETDVTGGRGILFGLSAAIMYACVILLNKFIRDISASDRTFFQLGVAAVFLLPYVLLTEDFSAFTVDVSSLIWLIVAGIIHTGIAYTLYFGSIACLPAQTVSLCSYLDPTIAVLLSFVVLREEMSLLSFIGVILVLGAAILGETEFKKK